MKIIELTADNIDKYQKCLLKVTSAYKNSNSILSDKERREWIFNRVWDLMYK